MTKNIAPTNSTYALIWLAVLYHFWRWLQQNIGFSLFSIILKSISRTKSRFLCFRTSVFIYIICFLYSWKKQRLWFWKDLTLIQFWNFRILHKVRSVIRDPNDECHRQPDTRFTRSIQPNLTTLPKRPLSRRPSVFYTNCDSIKTIKYSRKTIGLTDVRPIALSFVLIFFHSLILVYPLNRSSVGTGHIAKRRPGRFVQLSKSNDGHRCFESQISYRVRDNRLFHGTRHWLETDSPRRNQNLCRSKRGTHCRKFTRTTLKTQIR